MCFCPWGRFLCHCFPVFLRLCVASSLFCSSVGWSWWCCFSGGGSSGSTRLVFSFIFLLSWFFLVSQQFLPDAKYWRSSNIQIFKPVDTLWTNGQIFLKNCWNISGTLVTCKFMIKTEASIHCYSGWISSKYAYLDLYHLPFNHEITDIELVFSTVKITQLKLQKFL